MYLTLLIISLIQLTTTITNADTQCPIVSQSIKNNTIISNFRLVQYNVEWLFTDYYSNSKCPGSGCPWANTSQAFTHMDYVSNVIEKLNPDYINLCEVEGCDELNQLNNLLNSNYKPYLIKGTDTSTGQNVGLLTKIDPNLNLYRDESRIEYPISNSQCGYVGNSSTTGLSKHYITEMTINKYNVAIIGLHLLAYPTDPSRCAQREAQALIVQNIINKYLDLEYEIIVIGDLNDYDGEILDANNSKPTSQVLQILKTNDKLKSISNFISQDQRYTCWWDQDESCKSSPNEFSMIDHILLTPNLYLHVNSAFVYHGYDEFCGTLNSDHYPVIVDFVF